MRSAPAIPGFAPGSTGLVAVSLSGAVPDVRERLDLAWGPDEVVDAWREAR